MLDCERYIGVAGAGHSARWCAGVGYDPPPQTLTAPPGGGGAGSHALGCVWSSHWRASRQRCALSRSVGELVQRQVDPNTTFAKNIRNIFNLINRRSERL